MLLPLIHTSSRLDYTKQGLKIIKGVLRKTVKLELPQH